MPMDSEVMEDISAIVMGDDNQRGAVEYEAAATLASLISAPISSDDSDETHASSSSRRNEVERDVGVLVISSSNDSDAATNTARKEKNSNGTRKFTRSDEVLLIRGILKHGNSHWKKIWKETPELQHISHSALKDRGRSKRFQSVLKRAQVDPTLLDRPFELLGDEHSNWYEKATKNATQSNVKESNAAVGSAKLLSTSTRDPPQEENKLEEDTIQEEETNSGPSSPNTSAATKRKIAAAVEKSSEDYKKSKPEKAATSATKKSRTDDFPGWTVTKVKRKDSDLCDRFWSHPRLNGVKVRSRKGVMEMIAKMETSRFGARTAYDILMSEGKRKYFIGTLKS